MERNELVEVYFKLGFKYSEILHCLNELHGYPISLRTLKRITKHLGLFRRKNQSDIFDIAMFMLEQCEVHGQIHGYRWMHLKCIEKGFSVTQDTVRVLLHILDPEGIEMRKRRRLRRRMYSVPGPNALWHVDGYDKLSRYGIKVHGCIDGFSRQIIWLKADVSNKNPNVIASYYIESIRKYGIYPRRIRADMGTENVHIEVIQKFLRRNHGDDFAGDRSFIYRKSTLNQRIESLWGMVRRQGIQYWMNFFQELNEADLHDGGYLDQELSRFCFMEMIQDTLDDISSVWNRHRIRPYRQRNHRSGRPFMLHFMPSMFHAMDFCFAQDENDVRVCEEEIKSVPPHPCSDLIKDLCFCIMEENDIPLPENPEDMKHLYIFLREDIRSNL